jgi:hypothetical protein
LTRGGFDWIETFGALTITCKSMRKSRWEAQQMEVGKQGRKGGGASPADEGSTRDLGVSPHAGSPSPHSPAQADPKGIHT